MSAPPPAEPVPTPTSTFARKAAYIAAPGTIAFALLYYFGSVYTKAYYSTLSVLPEDLGFSVQGVVANSSSAVFVPVCLLLGGGLIAFLALGRLGLALAGPGRAMLRRRAIRWLLAAGVALVAVGFPALFTNAAALFPSGWPRRFLPALMVIVGATLAAFAVHLRLTEVPATRDRQARDADRMWLAGGTLAIGLLTLSLFFGMALYVADMGRGDAMLHADEGYEGIPTVVVHSKVPLAHRAVGIEFTDHGERSAPYRYEYRGFRVLAKAPARFYLISHQARSYRDRHVVMLPDDGTVWMEIYADS
ncbi:hypothetical protein ACWD1Z_03440 [Streptomyces sp. NPDC002784]